MTMVGHLTRAGICGLLLAAGIAASETGVPLIEAANVGDLAAVRRLLKTGAMVDAAAPDGSTPLHWAVYSDNFEMAQFLLRSGANPRAANRYGVVPLMPACTNGNAAIIELLLEAGADPAAATAQGETALMVAARTGTLEAVVVLLSHGADPNASERRRGQTALMWAAAEGHVATVEALIAAGGLVAARSDAGFTPLLFAVRQGQLPVVSALLRAGADVNDSLPHEGSRRIRPSDNLTGPRLLDLAVANAHFELAALLLDAGADPSGGKQGWTPLHALTWVRKPGSGSNDPPPRGSGNMSSLQLARKLVACGADVNARMTTRASGARTVLNMRGATPFLLAARTADAEFMRLLVELGADAQLPNDDNSTPLMVAAGVGVQAPGEDPGTEQEVVEAVTLALELGNDVNAVNKRGETAMHGAAYKHVASVVPLLADHGARIDIWNRKNSLGWTPLRIATGVHRGMNFRSSPETAAAIRGLMIAAGVPAVAEPETNISGATK